MPTNAHDSKYTAGLQRCFQALADEVSQFRKTYADSVVFVLGYPLSDGGILPLAGDQSFFNFGLDSGTLCVQGLAS
jgi:hypothetical protein